MPRVWSAGILGWCAAENGEPERGIALLTEAIAGLRAAQSRHFMHYLLGLLTQVHINLGHDADAMKAVEGGLALADAGGERFYSAELHRLRGELCARSSDDRKRQAEKSFRTAIELARKQGAAALESRAKASLCRWAR